MFLIRIFFFILNNNLKVIIKNPYWGCVTIGVVRLVSSQFLVHTPEFIKFKRKKSQKPFLKNNLCICKHGLNGLSETVYKHKIITLFFVKNDAMYNCVVRTARLIFSHTKLLHCRRFFFLWKK